MFNPDKKNARGYPVSYVLENHAHGEPLLAPDDYKRAGFIAYDFWVTAYNPEERYAAGAHQIKTRQNLDCLSMSRMTKLLRRPTSSSGTHLLSITFPWRKVILS